MTGRELIIYILANGLEDKPVLDDGEILGFMSIEKAAVKFGVGYGTIRAWITMGRLKAFLFANKYYIPADAELLPFKEEMLYDPVVQK